MLNKLLYRYTKDRVLRVVDGTVKGFLSEGYTPIDQSKVIAAWVEAMKKNGGIPTGGSVTEWRYAIDGIWGGGLVEAIPGEWIVPGVQIRSSDYGSHAATIYETMWRIHCTNLAVGQSVFKQRHVGGGGWNTGDGYRVSPKTENLAAQAAVSAIGDVLGQVFTTRHIDAMVTEYTKDAETHLDAAKTSQRLNKAGVITKPEAETLETMVKNEMRIEVLPQTQDPESVLRYKQAIAWLAQGAEGDRQLDLQRVAWTLSAAKEDAE